jgi:hypothetical protein
MNTFTLLLKSFLVAFLLFLASMSNQAFAQQEIIKYVNLDYNTYNLAVDELSFTVMIKDAEVDPNAVHTLNPENSWLLGENDFTYEIKPVTGNFQKWKVTFTLNDTSKAGSGHVAEIGFGLVVVTEENFKNDDHLIEIIDVEAKFKDFDATLYPNPATNQVHWNANITEGTSVQLIHTNGKVENVTWEAGKAIDVSHLPRGFYIVRFANNDQTVTRKLVLR